MLPSYEAPMKHGQAQDREFSEPLAHNDLVRYLFASIIYEDIQRLISQEPGKRSAKNTVGDW